MPILAQYSIRAKQEYIFRNKRMLELIEIVGASDIIRDSFDDLHREAVGAGLDYRKIAKEKTDKAKRFDMDAVNAAFRDGTLDAVELFRGGGNLTVLYRSREQFRTANEAYTRYVLERFPGLLPLCVGVETDCLDYQADIRKLTELAAHKKEAMRQGRVENAQPFARQDRSTLRAIAVEIRRKDGTGETVEYRTAEADAKYRKGVISVKTDEPSKWLDDLAKDGRRSLLAIVHADGNAMRVKIRNKLGANTDYTSCVNVMREFSAEIEDVFIRRGGEAVEQRRQELAKTYPEASEKNLRIRWMVRDGDDVTFLCNAKYALELTKAYLQAINSSESFSACAGICVFHAHYPFYRAYDLAEQACDNAKKEVHKSGREEAWLDFHYLRSGVNGDLEDIRELHRTRDCIGRPWFFCEKKQPASVRRLDRLEKLIALLQAAGVARTQLLALGDELETSQDAGELVWRRLCYNTIAPADARKMEALFDNEKERLFRALYDLSDFCDLWFWRGGNRNG